MTRYYPTLGFDPAPGDVGVVQNLHETVSRVAGQLGSAHGALSRLGRSDGVWQGQAAQAFARRVGELPKHLADGENSMSAACRALSTWSTELVDFQHRAAAYERQAADTASDELSRIISKAHGLLVEHDNMASRVAKSLLDASDISTVLGVVATVCMFIPPSP